MSRSGRLTKPFEVTSTCRVAGVHHKREVPHRSLKGRQMETGGVLFRAGLKSELPTSEGREKRAKTSERNGVWGAVLGTHWQRKYRYDEPRPELGETAGTSWFMPKSPRATRRACQPGQSRRAWRGDAGTTFRPESLATRCHPHVGSTRQCTNSTSHGNSVSRQNHAGPYGEGQGGLLDLHGLAATAAAAVPGGTWASV